MAELRKDPITGLWVISAPERAQRPQQTSLAGRQSPCPFCAGNEAETPPEVFAIRDSTTSANEPGWRVRAVPNRYPALTPHAESHSESDRELSPAIGAHEVIIESPEHVEDLTELDEEQFARVLHTYRHRMAVLGSDTRWRSLFLFKNQGIAAGGSLLHVHSQLIAMATTPPQLEKEFCGARDYYTATGRCAYCDMINQELGTSTRVVDVESNYLAFCPHASRVPYETWIMPRYHGSHFEAGAPEHDIGLARILRDTLRRLEKALSTKLFNYIVHSGPLHEGESPYFHWHLEMLPRLVQFGGFEWGSGTYINSVRPEDAARLLRQVAP